MHQTTTQLLYDGNVEINFHWDDEKPRVHYYTIGNSNEKLLGVTTVLGILNKPALIPWAVNMACDQLAQIVQSGVPMTLQHIEDARLAHRKASAQAASIGTQVHEWCSQYIQDTKQELPEDSQVLNGVLGFLQWARQHNVVFEETEKIVYSKKYGYVGTLDAEAIIDGKRCLVDFKTSKGIYNEMRYQVAAYQFARQEEFGKIYTGKPIIARFDKATGNFEHIKIKNISKDFKAFKGLLAAKKREQELNDKK
jgi:hypothetical protein